MGLPVLPGFSISGCPTGCRISWRELQPPESFLSKANETAREAADREQYWAEFLVLSFLLAIILLELLRLALWRIKTRRVRQHLAGAYSLLGDQRLDAAVDSFLHRCDGDSVLLEAVDVYLDKDIDSDHTRSVRTVTALAAPQKMVSMGSHTMGLGPHDSEGQYQIPDEDNDSPSSRKRRPAYILYWAFLIFTVLLVAIGSLQEHVSVAKGWAWELMLIWMSVCLMDLSVQVVAQSFSSDGHGGPIFGEAILSVLPGFSNRADHLLDCTFLAFCFEVRSLGSIMLGLASFAVLLCSYSLIWHSETFSSQLMDMHFRLLVKEDPDATHLRDAWRSRDKFRAYLVQQALAATSSLRWHVAVCQDCPLLLAKGVFIASIAWSRLILVAACVHALRAGIVIGLWQVISVHQKRLELYSQMKEGSRRARIEAFLLLAADEEACYWVQGRSDFGIAEEAARAAAHDQEATIRSRLASGLLIFSLASPDVALELLVDLCQDQEAVVRTEAFKTLLTLCLDTDMLADSPDSWGEVLETLCEDGDSDVRLRVAVSMETLYRHAPTAIAFTRLTPLCLEKDGMVREQAFQVLAALGSKSADLAFPTLQELAKAPDSDVRLRTAAAAEVVATGTAHLHVLALLTPLARDPEAAVRTRAFEALASLAGAMPHLVFPAFQSLVEDTNEVIREHALEALSRLAGTFPRLAFSSLKSLALTRDDSSASLRQSAFNTLCALAGPGPHPAFNGLSRQQVEDLRGRAFETLGSLSLSSPEEVLAALAVLAKTSQRDIRNRAFEEICRVLAVSSAGVLATLKELAKEEDPSTRRRVAESISFMARDSPKGVLEILQGLLLDSDALVRSDAFHALAKAGNVAPEITATILEALVRDEDIEVQTQALEVLCIFATESPKTALGVLAKLSQERDDVRRGAAAALTKLGQRNAKSLNLAFALIELLVSVPETGPWEPKHTAGLALAQLGASAHERAFPLLEALARDRRGQVQVVVAEAMQHVGLANADRALALLEKLLEEGERPVLHVAIPVLKALGPIEPDRCMRLLEELSKDPLHPIRGDVANALQAMCSVAPLHACSLLQALAVDKYGEVREKVAPAAGALAYHAPVQALAILEQLSGDSLWPVRLEVAKTMAQLAETDRDQGSSRLSLRFLTGCQRILGVLASDEEDLVRKKANIATQTLSRYAKQRSNAAPRV